MELDSTVYRFTVNALEQAPAGGGGGSSDWNADERTAIRAILGVPASGTTPDDPTTGILDTIRDSVATRASQTSVDIIDSTADSILSDTDDLQVQIGVDGAGLTALPWRAAWDVEIESEVTDALNALTLSEPTGKPVWGASSWKDFMAWMAAFSVNKVTQSTTTKTLRNDADNGNIVTCATSDNGTTFTLSECTP